MSDIERWTVVGDTAYPNPGGAWVKYVDHADSVQRLRERLDTSRQLTDAFGTALCKVSGDKDRLTAYANAPKVAAELRDKLTRADALVGVLMRLYEMHRAEPPKSSPHLWCEWAKRRNAAELELHALLGKSPAGSDRVSE